MSDNVIQIEDYPILVGIKRGEEAIITFHDGSRAYIILDDLSRNGIHGFDVSLKSKPLTFYPFAGIKKLVKNTEDTDTF